MDFSNMTPEFFDASSKAWKANKVRYGQAAYRYKKNAFKKDPEEPLPPSQSAASKKRTDKELDKRQQQEEEAPPRVRRSPRIREEELNQIYQR